MHSREWAVHGSREILKKQNVQDPRTILIVNYTNNLDNSAHVVDDSMHETCNFAVAENRKPRLAMSTAADKQN